jgi:hypothetical protein
MMQISLQNINRKNFYDLGHYNIRNVNFGKHNGTLYSEYNPINYVSTKTNACKQTQKVAFTNGISKYQAGQNMTPLILSKERKNGYHLINNGYGIAEVGSLEPSRCHGIKKARKVEAMVKIVAVDLDKVFFV